MNFTLFRRSNVRGERGEGKERPFSILPLIAIVIQQSMTPYGISYTLTCEGPSYTFFFFFAPSHHFTCLFLPLFVPHAASVRIYTLRVLRWRVNCCRSPLCQPHVLSNVRFAGADTLSPLPLHGNCKQQQKETSYISLSLISTLKSRPQCDTETYETRRCGVAKEQKENKVLCVSDFVTLFIFPPTAASDGM